MQTYRWKRVGTALMSGLAVCLVTTSLSAQSPAGVGIVRISDRPQRSYPHNGRIQQTSSSSLRQVDAQRGYLTQPTPYVTNSGPAHAMTGNPVVDLIRTASLRHTASTSTRQCSSCSGGGGCSSCQQRAGNVACDGRGCDRSQSDFERRIREYADADYKRKRRLFGYFMPDGCNGQGCPAKGHYHLLYSANPRYFDPRDGRVYAAQGHGIPMAVPLAPNVSHTYNYGWGIPSSRLTPISTRAPF